ncbi:NAD(P)(+) transhydrogenase (Re/Si-specific) subunit beta [Pirellulales bacterium]|jgi:NAD(P) transhydrogenase subunit beta|nr:NAD(P)(+) transhydrogenase (Re/Si-specific) subunit beta [Pirellulales bacterium]
MSSQAWINLAYLTASMLFIVAFKQMGGPRTAVRGNLLGATGMAIAILAACFEQPVTTSIAEYGIWPLFMLIVFAAIGGGIGATMAIRWPMTGMPQMVALLNGFGGAASMLVAAAELTSTRAVSRFEESTRQAAASASLEPWTQFAIAIGLACFIGSVTLTGSLVAFGKLQELPQFKKPWNNPNRQWINLALAITALLLLWGVFGTSQLLFFLLLVLVAAALGVTLTLPIGGADMPVVICLLNSYSGLAAAAAGFVIDNSVLVIAGSLVGASGLILTAIMCKAMNRSLVGVLFGGLGTTSIVDSDEVYAGKIKSAETEELAMILEQADRVVIVPGYGLAVAQAQHAVRELADVLEARGTSVEYAIHPVAGRMPGHMNVLLAEADVPYEQLREMDDINPSFPETDVAIVIGANDVVNPSARNDPDSPIAGMPILDVGKAQTVIVIKRSLSPGFAGIPNPLFAADNTLMYFADGKKALIELTAAVTRG